MIQFRYPPSPLQQKWINAYAREKLFGGAKRGGKSVALAEHIALLCMLYPGNRGLLARKHLTDLKDSTLAEFLLTVPGELFEHRKGDRSLKFHNGSECLYRGLGEEGEFEKAKSMTLGFLAIDEPSEIPFAAVSQLNAQLTHTLPDGSRPPYMMLLASNPEPGWVKQRYVDCGEAELLRRNHLYVQALPRDNPGLPPGWEDELRGSMDPDWVRRYLDGSWDVFEGQVFDELSPNVHDLDIYTAGWLDSTKERFFSNCKRLAAIDHGTTGTTACVVLLVDESGNNFVLGEYYEQNKLIAEHAVGIKRLLEKWGPIDRLLIDPSTEAKTQQGQHELFSYLDVYRREGVMAQPAARAAIGVGLDLQRSLIRVNGARVSPFSQQRGSPALFISRSAAPNLWKEMTELRKELTQDGKGVKYVGADHANDCLRYCLMSRPDVPFPRPMDVTAMPTLDRFKVESERAFARKFGEQIGTGNSWW